MNETYDRGRRVMLALTLGCLFGAIAVMAYLPPRPLTAQDRPAEITAARGTAARLPDFVSVAKGLGPSLVHISVIPKRQTQTGSGLFDQEHRADRQERFYGGQPPAGSPRRGLGSGFIIDGDGHILTNDHVVNDAAKVIVRLVNDREYEARIVGRDTKADVAVLKIDSPAGLTAAPLGNSDELQPGEWVVAMGSPFGLDRTLTVGIVSALGRRIGTGPYDNYIQTDASINPGNSGGPLINLHGDVVGINTAIVSESGGNSGIGFAIPINFIKQILPELKQKGRVTRGWLGVSMQTISPSLAESLGVESGGALIADLAQGGPADRAGMQRGDVIIEYDNKPIVKAAELPILVAQTPIGKRIQLKVRRRGTEVPVSIVVGELKEKEQAAAASAPRAQLGLGVQAVHPQLAAGLGLASSRGVLITSVHPGSIAEEAGLARGDVIIEINRSAVNSAEDFQAAVRRADRNMLFLVRRGGTNLFVALSAPRPTG